MGAERQSTVIMLKGKVAFNRVFVIVPSTLKEEKANAMVIIVQEGLGDKKIMLFEKYSTEIIIILNLNENRMKMIFLI